MAIQFLLQRCSELGQGFNWIVVWSPTWCDQSTLWTLFCLFELQWNWKRKIDLVLETITFGIAAESKDQRLVEDVD